MGTTYNNQGKDLNTKAEEFLNETILNVILKELPQKYKSEFYNLVEQDRYEEAKDFALSNIPDFENKLLARIKELLSK